MKWTLRNKKGQFIPIQPNLKPSLSLAYILGVILGDGCVTKYYDKSSYGYGYEVRLEVIDEDFADMFTEHLKNIGLNPYRYIRYRRDKSDYCVKARSVVFYKWFHSLNLQDIYNLLISEKQKSMFVRGFFDSDGHATFATSKQIGISNSNMNKLRFLQKLCRELGITSTIVKQKQKKKMLNIKTKYFKIFSEIIGSSINRKIHKLKMLGGVCYPVSTTG